MQVRKLYYKIWKQILSSYGIILQVFIIRRAGYRYLTISRPMNSESVSVMFQRETLLFCAHFLPIHVTLQEWSRVNLRVCLHRMSGNQSRLDLTDLLTCNRRVTKPKIHGSVSFEVVEQSYKLEHH